MKRAVVFIVLALAVAAAQTHHFERMRTPSGGWAICGHCGAPENPPSKITITSPNEPGEPMVISGVLYKSDGKTPAEGMTIFVYHTGADGYYNHPNDPFQPRLYGYMKTGRDGRYEFRTIKPGRYPDHTEQAHIHIHVFGPNYRERFLAEYYFANDRKLATWEQYRVEQAGTASAIVQLTKGSDGAWHGTRNFILP